VHEKRNFETFHESQEKVQEKIFFFGEIYNIFFLHMTRAIGERLRLESGYKKKNHAPGSCDWGKVITMFSSTSF